MNLRDIVGDYPTKDIIGTIDIHITGIQHDSRKVTRGNLFIAQRGFTVDGHNYINEAIVNGAIAIVLETNIKPIEGVTFIYVEDSTDGLGYLCSKFYPISKDILKIIGITGTNGKTTTSFYLNSILEKNYVQSAVLGTMGAYIDGVKTKLENTTPDSLIIQENLNKMIKVNTEICIMEVSSHALDLKRVNYLDFHTGIFTNLSKDHLDYHKNMEDYFNSKLKLFLNTYKSNIINIDDPYGKKILNIPRKDIKNITYGIKEKADVYATDIRYYRDRTEFTLHTPLNQIKINLNTLGEFNIYNALAAAACSYSLSIDIQTIKSGLESIENIKGRLETVKTNKDFTIIIDFAHTPDGLEKVLLAIKTFAKGRIIVLFGAGGNRDKSKRPEMGEIVGKNSDFAIVTSDNPRFEEPEAIIEDILVGIKKTDVDYISITDRKQAINYALKIAQTNDVILLAGKGHEAYTIIGDKVYPFDERQIVLDIIREI